ncbi:MAG: hypothetical protein L6262_08425 [Weeksellaceae bacterium]|nr:hypothetical protein [Weeksellaceae bacterium]
MATALLVVSCDIPAGGNKGRLKKTDDVVRYSDPSAPKATYSPVADTAQVEPTVEDTAKTVVAPEVKTATAATPKAKH